MFSSNQEFKIRCKRLAFFDETQRKRIKVKINQIDEM